MKVIRKCNHRNKKNEILWLCKCDCGEEIESTAGRLNSGNTKSCGCTRKEKLLVMNKNKVVDMRGLKIGKLTIISKTNEKTSHGNIKWLCKCDCGNETKVSQGHLHSGKTKSCGCSTKESVSKTGSKYGGRNFEDLTGEVFGWLKVINRIYDIKKYPTYECECLLCGNTKISKGKLLKNGKVKSCGCVKSVSEQIVQEMFENNNIIFKSQYRFEDCRNINPLPFDFVIFDTNKNIIFALELDGIHHYIEQDNFNNLEYVKNNDNIKNKYCADNDIDLIRIPYYEFNNLSKIIKELLVRYNILN